MEVQSKFINKFALFSVISPEFHRWVVNVFNLGYCFPDDARLEATVFGSSGSSPNPDKILG